MGLNFNRRKPTQQTKKKNEYVQHRPLLLHRGVVYPLGVVFEQQRKDKESAIARGQRGPARTTAVATLLRADLTFVGSLCP